jgi:hypothetical protein
MASMERGMEAAAGFESGKETMIISEVSYSPIVFYSDS